jgi:hypothetical protein
MTLVKAWSGLALVVILVGMLLLNDRLPSAYAGQPLETETARLLKAGSLEIEGTFEYQTSSEGTETAVPMALGYGLTDTLELLVEPAFYTAIRPKVGRQASGRGDLEVTLTQLFFHETLKLPALAIAGEVKFPTAKDTLIGTGKTDYTGYLIASKRVGKFDTHANIGYTVLGKPAGVRLHNIIDYGLAEEIHLNEKVELVAELIGNTSSSSKSTEGSTSPEIAGGELAGMLGARYYVQPNFFLSLGVTYDNNNAILVRPGLTVKF